MTTLHPGESDCHQEERKQVHKRSDAQWPLFARILLCLSVVKEIL